MKVAVIGSRGLCVPDLEKYLPAEVTEIISGGARGVDTSAKEYALLPCRFCRRGIVFIGVEGWKLELNFHVTGPERKCLVTAMAEYLNCEVQYLGVPSCAYRVGNFLIEKTGIVRFEDSVDDNLLRQLTQKLEQEGFSADAATELTIQMPIPDQTALANLYALVEAKGSLMKKALVVDDLPIRRLEDRLEFPWFPADAEPEEIKTYLHFVTALCDLAKSQKRVSSREKPVENEKYAFRCFLLRLGFIGAEFKTERKILLRNLTGSSAFKSGKKEADDDVSQ